jgi:glucose/arabinose dehydrogenase
MHRPAIRTLSLSCLLALATFAANADEKSPPFDVKPVAQLQEPWALTFLPDGRMLVTEKKGKLRIVTQDGKIGDVSGVPAVDYGGQGGLGDVVLHPKFAQNGVVYLSFAEAGEGDVRGAALARGKLELDDEGGGTLRGLEVIWRQAPKVDGRGHYSHRVAFAPDGLMFVSSGERQHFDPAQDMKSNMGKILRLNDDGTPAKDNPFAAEGGVTAEIWSLGHRNVLGLAFDPAGKLWDIEMGPKGGDELNLVVRGANYGYPVVSNGNHYDGKDIPDHDTRPEFAAPKITWTPVISPSSLIFYSGKLFPDWEGDAFAGGLSGKALVRIEFEGESAKEAERYEMGQRIREVEQGPDGALWLLEDQDEGTGGRLLKLTPRK